MPSFCRHNRFEDSCPICSKKKRITPPKRREASGQPSQRRTPSTGPRRGRGPRTRAGTSAVTIRRVERAADDGYDNELVPGIRASADARRLAEELAFAAARLDVLASDPPGLYGRIAAEPDREEAIWLCFLTAYMSPLEDDAPFAEIERVHVPWATGELPEIGDARPGPRTAHDPARGTATLQAYRVWAQKAGSQAAGLAGDAALTPQRRFDQLWGRLALPGFRRTARFEFLLLASRLGLADIEPWTLKFADADPSSPVGVGARRVFGTGDAIELQRRAAGLMGAVGAPMAALDLALWNWSRVGEERVTGGVALTRDAGLNEAYGALGVSGP